jgi:hypothetical protein
MEASIKQLQSENDRLRNICGSSKQESFIELQDKIEMLNRRRFGDANESLNKLRPSRDKDRKLLPHNVPPIDLSENKRVDVPEVEIEHSEVSCTCCESPNLEKIVKVL